MIHGNYHPYPILMQTLGLQPQAAQEQAALAQDPNTPQTMGTNTLGAMLGAVEGQEPHMPPLPGTVNPDFPRAMSPGFSQNLMNLLMQMSGPPANVPSLGAILSGRV